VYLHIYNAATIRLI